MTSDLTLRFQIAAPDGRCSDVWRVWTVKNDVYVAPRTKGGEFKISLHKSGKWRLAFTSDYAEKMRRLGTWRSERCVEPLDRPVPHALGLTRAVRLYFPDSELRPLVGSRDVGNVVEIPAASKNSTRVVDVLFTTRESRFTKSDPPLGGSLGAKPLVSRPLPNEETLWVVQFELSGLRGLDGEAEFFRNSIANAKRLDERALG